MGYATKTHTHMHTRIWKGQREMFSSDVSVACVKHGQHLSTAFLGGLQLRLGIRL